MPQRKWCHVGKNLYCHLCLCMCYAFFSIGPQVSKYSCPVYVLRKVPVPLLMSMCLCIGKGPCTPLFVSMCVLCFPSLSGKAYSHPCVYCISPLLQKDPRSVSLFMSMYVSHLYIPSPTEGPPVLCHYSCPCVYIFPLLQEGPSIGTCVNVCMYF